MSFAPDYLRAVRKSQSIAKVARIFFGRDAVHVEGYLVSVVFDDVWHHCDSWSDLDSLIDNERELALDQDEKPPSWTSIDTSVW